MYLIFSVQDRILFHQVNTKSNIFTSGVAMSEKNIFGVHEWNATRENIAFGAHSVK